MQALLGKRRISGWHRHGSWRTAASLFAVLALLLRLATPIAPAPPPDPRALALATLGEHALCLADSSAPRPDAGSRQQAPAGPAEHSGHDCLACCAVGDSGAGSLSQTAPLAVVFAAAAPAFPPDAFAGTLARWRFSLGEPRAPPLMG